MSELKAFIFCLGQYTENGSPCVVAVDDEDNPRLASDEKFYLKSEADKVIVEKDKQLRHQKYKRCLAMTDYSMYHHFRMLEIYGKRLDNDRAVFKINFGLKWLYRWLELAEKFKPDN